MKIEDLCRAIHAEITLLGGKNPAVFEISAEEWEASLDEMKERLRPDPALAADIGRRNFLCLGIPVVARASQ